MSFSPSSCPYLTTASTPMAGPPLYTTRPPAPNGEGLYGTYKCPFVAFVVTANAVPPLSTWWTCTGVCLERSAHMNLDPWNDGLGAACYQQVVDWPYDPWPTERPVDWPPGWDFQPTEPVDWTPPPYWPAPQDWPAPVWPAGQPMNLRATTVPGCRQWHPGRF